MELHAQDIKSLIANAGDHETFPSSGKITLFDSTLVRVQETGLSYVDNHVLYKVLTPQGALGLSVIKYGYDPLSAYVDIKSVTIHHRDGRTTSLDVSKTMDYPAPARAIYWGAREKMIEIGRLNPGDAVEVSFFKKGFTYALLAENQDDEKYIPPMRGHYYDIVTFFSREPILEKVYQVQVPNTKHLQYKFYHGTVDSTIIK
ncbi:MAG: transglutaminase, partial [Bacteroidetes bacterium]